MPTLTPNTLRDARAGKFTRKISQRLSNDHLLFRAKLLPPDTHALLVAHLEFGMGPIDLAPLHNLSIPHMRRKLQRLRETLCDPAFLLAAKFSQRLPAELRDLATHYWVDCMTLREIAHANTQTIHTVRQNLQTARALLILEAKNVTKVNAQEARQLLDGKPAAKPS